MDPSSDDKGKRPREEDHQDPKLKEEQEAGKSRARNFCRINERRTCHFS
jgi:hypothetical protein